MFASYMFSAILAGLPPCLRELRRALGYTNRAFPSRFKPRCKKDGSYENMQCLLAGSKSEVCWCVDIDGKELIGTRVFGKASCIQESGKVAQAQSSCRFSRHYIAIFELSIFSY